ncbi:enhancer of polycomb homolog 2 [Stegastes partitus]|uniref:Enhancer of polycomb homolog 2 n=1 Tax=Stegastes partitus TaxID=144197 RepID=A0A9Y4K2R3_9TELE|nr:PREDICTED: enhancer of polycomb homolog 2-like [Stegastes partitus]
MCRMNMYVLYVAPAALGLDLEQPDYDMDSEDETLLNRLNRKMELRPLQFETMVDRLEKASTHQLVSLSEAKLLLNEDDYLLKSVYDYWVRKRKHCRGPSLVPHVKQEKRDGSTNSDAYVAFRRRTEKMQTRKNRKNDEASYEKMLRLRREFSRTVTILEMIKRREKSKRELLHLTLEVVERRYQMGDFSGDVLREVSVPLLEKPAHNTPFTLNNCSRHKSDFRTKVQKPRRVVSGQVSGFIQVSPVGVQVLSVNVGGLTSQLKVPQSDSTNSVNRNDVRLFLKPRTEQAGGDSSPELVPPCLRHSLTELSLPPHWMGLSRRRIGRGGRIILDRASCALDPTLQQPDSLTHPVSRTRTRTGTCLLGDPLSPDQRPPLSSGTTCPSLAEVLSNIQSLRRFCFRPRPAQDHRTTGSTPEDSRLTCRLSPDLSCGPAGGITEEQYHSHQQQLVQMQKQQLEQLQLQNNTFSYRHTALHTTQSCRSSESSSKTLDSATAQFAASAVISTPPPPHGAISSENKPYRSSMNGVHPSGPSRPPYSSSISRAGLSARGSLSSSSSSHQSLPNQRSQVGAVSPAHPHASPPSSTDDENNPDGFFVFRRKAGCQYLPHDITFQHDDAQPHAARICMEFLQTEDTEVLDWPAYSPDMSPVEHLWDVLDRRVWDRVPVPGDVDQLRVALQEEWSNIPGATTDNLINSM